MSEPTPVQLGRDRLVHRDSGEPAGATCGDGCCDEPATSPSEQAGLTEERRRALTRRVRLLVAATITYNVVEAAVAIAAGTVASSTALIGFGLDSVIEVASAAAVAWQFSGADPEARERAALKVIAMSFFALAVYVTASRSTRSPAPRNPSTPPSAPCSLWPRW